MAAAYYSQLEADKDWDARLRAKLAEAVQAAKGTLKPPVPPPPPPPPPPAATAPPPNAPAPAAAAPPAAPAEAAPAPPAAPAAGPSPEKEAAEPAVPEVPAPAPAPVAQEAKAPPAAPAPPAVEAPAPSDEAAAILKATEAAEKAAGKAVEADAADAADAAPLPPATEALAPAPAPAPAAAAAPPPPPPAAASSPGAAVAAAEAAAVALLSSDGAVPSAPLPSGLPPGSLGLGDADLSPLGLVRSAVASAGRGVQDWSQWPERHEQAVADSKLFFEALQTAAAWHEEQMEQVRGELAAERGRADSLEAAGEAAAARFKALLRQSQESFRELLELEIRQAEKRGRLERERERLAEASQRAASLESLRATLGSLSLAHAERVRRAGAAAAGHAVAAGAAAVAAAAESGADLAAAAAALRGVAAEDEVVGSVLVALPEGRVDTRAELSARFRRLRTDLGALSHLPRDRTGLVAVAVARLAARLKADEADAVRVLGPEYGSGGVDAALARTEALLAEGRLAAAAEGLAAALGGTAAAALAADWVEAARRRAAAEAAVAALNAHAAATWASLA